MIIRIIFFSTSPDSLKEGKKIWDNEMAPLIKKQKGFLKAYRADAQDEPGEGSWCSFGTAKRTRKSGVQTRNIKR